MTKYRFFGLVFVCLSFFSDLAHASTLGDLITVRRAFPTVEHNYAPPQIVNVVAGSSDVISIQGDANVNIESSEITIDYVGTNQFGFDSDTVFNGYAFEGFSSEIESVEVINTNIEIYSLSFGLDYIHLNLLGSYYNQTSKIKLIIKWKLETSSMQVDIRDKSDTQSVPAIGGDVYFDKEITNTGISMIDVTSFSQLIFPNGEVVNVDEPYNFRLDSSQVELNNNWKYEVESWLPNGTYTIKFTAIEKSSNTFYSDVTTFVKGL